MPQNFPALTAQVGAAEATANEVVVLEVVDEVGEVGFEVVIDVVEEAFKVGPPVDVVPVEGGVDFVLVDDDPLDPPVEVLIEFVLVGDVVCVPETG